MPRPPAGLCDSCRHQRLVRNTRGSTLLALRALAHRPGLSALPAPAGDRVRRVRAARDPSPRARHDARDGSSAAVLVLCLAGGGRGDRARGRRRRRGDAPAASAAGRWTALRPALLARTEVAAARVGRFVYVVGGFERRSGGTTAAVERYDLRRDRWRRVRSMPVALNHPAAAAYRGDVYVVGGYTGRGDLRGEVSSLYRYDPGRDRWSRLPNAPTQPRRARRRRRSAAGSTPPAAPTRPTGRCGASRSTTSHAAAGRRGPDMEFAREHLAGAVAGRRVLRAGRTRRRPRQLQGRRALPPARAALGAAARHGKPRGGIGAAAVARPGRGRRRRGAVGHDPRGRGLRPARRAAGAGCPTCARRATASASCLAAAASTRSRAARRPASFFSRAIEALDGRGSAALLPHRLLLGRG